MSDKVFRMAGDPPIDFKAVDNGDGTYSLAVSGTNEGGGVSFITEVDDTATIQLQVEDGVLTATVIGGNFADAEHGHEQSEITGLTAALAGKADAEHGHEQSEITGLTAALANKADESALAGKADAAALTSHINDTAAHQDTTYATMSAAEAEAGTSSTPRTITAEVLAAEIDRRIAEALAEVE